MAPAARDVGVRAPYRSHGGAWWAAAPEGVGRHRCRPPPPPRQPPFPEVAGGSRCQERRCNLPQSSAAGGACSITRSRQQASFDGSEPSARCRCRSSFPANKISDASTMRMRRARQASIESAVARGFHRRLLPFSESLAHGRRCVCFSVGSIRLPVLRRHYSRQLSTTR